MSLHIHASFSCKYFIKEEPGISTSDANPGFFPGLILSWAIVAFMAAIQVWIIVGGMIVDSKTAIKEARYKTNSHTV